MNETITIDGQVYEVLGALTILSQDATHALVGQSGNLVRCKFTETQRGPCFRIADSLIYFRDMVKLGIQPLKLIPKNPVEFVGEVADTILGSKFLKVPVNVPLGTKFRCTQIMEEGE